MLQREQLALQREQLALDRAKDERADKRARRESKQQHDLLKLSIEENGVAGLVAAAKKAKAAEAAPSTAAEDDEMLE